MPSTSRLSIPYPAGSDPVDVNGDLQAAVEVLDDAALADQGLLSARPAAGLMGRLYRATDNGKVYWDTGSAWVAASAATATADLDAAAVTTAKIADAAVTSAKLKPTVLFAAGNNDLTVVDALSDIPGATVTFTPAVASTLLITAFFHFRIDPNSFVLGEVVRVAGRVIVDGTAQGAWPGAPFALEQNVAGSVGTTAVAGTAACQVIANVTAASHTVKLQAELLATPVVGQVLALATSHFSVLVLSQ